MVQQKSNKCEPVWSFLAFDQCEGSSDILWAYMVKMCFGFLNLSAAFQTNFTEMALRDYWNGACSGRDLYWKIFVAYRWSWGICVKNKNIPCIAQMINTKQRSIALWISSSGRQGPATPVCVIVNIGGQLIDLSQAFKEAYALVIFFRPAFIACSCSLIGREGSRWGKSEFASKMQNSSLMI